MTATFAPTLLLPTLRAAWAALAAAAILAPASAAQVQVDWVADTRGVSVAVDGADNVFTADYEQNLGTEITVTKRDVDGNLLWVSEIDQTDTTKWERAAWVAVDSQGAVLVCGTLMSGFSNPVAAASLLLKFAPDGTPVYRIVYESGFDGSSTRKLLIDESDNAYVLGLGSGPSGLVTRIKKFTPGGIPVWSWFDAHGIGAPVNFKFAPNGDMVVAARAIFGSINGYARVDRQGNGVWALPGVQSLTVGDAAGDALGNTYLVHGEFVTSGGTVIKKLDAQGTLVWEKVYPSSGFRIEVGSDDAPMVSGFPDSGTAGAAFFKVDPAGDLLWSNLDADGPLGLLLHAHMLLDASGNAYLAASTLFEMAVCKVHADGSSAWTATTSGSNSAGIALGHAAGTVFVVGGATARLVEDVGTAAFCFGNATDCPCGNGGSGDGGCDLPQATGGVVLAVQGFAPNFAGGGNAQLIGTGYPSMSSPAAILIRSPAAETPPVVFGDGLRCIANGGLVRLGSVSASGGSSTHATSHAAGAGTFYYQLWFRSTPSMSCDPLAAFNLSNGLALTWP